MPQAEICGEYRQFVAVMRQARGDGANFCRRPAGGQKGMICLRNFKNLHCIPLRGDASEKYLDWFAFTPCKISPGFRGVSSSKFSERETLHHSIAPAPPHLFAHRAIPQQYI